MHSTYSLEGELSFFSPLLTYFWPQSMWIFSHTKQFSDFPDTNCVYLVTQSCPTLCNPMGCSPPGSSVNGILQARILEWVAMPSSRDLPNPGIKPRSPALQADSLLSEPPGKPMNIGVGSLSLLQGIFLTQELNRGLLHCRRILYQLSYQVSQRVT